MTDCSELERRDFEKRIRDLEEQVERLQECLKSRDDFEQRIATALKTLIPSRPAKGGDL